MMKAGGMDVSMTWPVSAKGILWREGKILLLANERNECELPGGHIEPGETPEDAVVREWREETELQVRVQNLVDAVFYTPLSGPEHSTAVLLLIYLVSEPHPGAVVTLSEEHQKSLWISHSQLPDDLPGPYRRAIRKCAEMEGDQGAMGRVVQTLSQRLAHDRGDRLDRLATDMIMTPRIGIGEGLHGDH